MTNEETKQALINGKPVVVKIPRQHVMEFSSVSAVVYRRDEQGRIKVSVELLDKNKNSVIYAEPKFVEYA